MPLPSTAQARRSTATRTVRAGIATDAHHGAVGPPIHLSSTFAFAAFRKPRTYDYTRSGNPTRDHLAGAIADLEGGVAAIVTGSGMSALTLVLQLLRPGDRVVAAHDCYAGTHRALTALAARGHFDVAFVDLTHNERVAEALAGRPRMVWVETPSNPLLRITDLRRVSRAAHATETIVVADNTFLSPVLQQPLALGADLAVHSTTKYLNCHSDVVGGAVVARDKPVADELAWWANCLGLTGAPFDSYLTLRGLRTLHLRMRAHEENAPCVVDLLASSPAVARVHYPGLPKHPGHALACTQQAGFGAMVSFDLDGGKEAVEAFLCGLRHFTLAESLGGVESLVAHPSTMTHASMGEAARAAAGIGENLLRLSVGIEDAQDLLEDLARALERANRAPELRGAATEAV